MKIVLGSPVLVRGGDGRRAHVVDIVLSNDGPDGSLMAICFIKFEDGDQWWSGGSHWLIPDPNGMFLTFEMKEHLNRLMLNKHVDTGKPLNGSEHGKATHKAEQ
jgi:hypothetical protein